MVTRIALSILLLVYGLQAQKFYTYVGQLSHDRVTLAWGTAAGGGNTIGREARSPGEATIKVGSKEEKTRKTYVEIKGLDADTEYPYEVWLNGRKVGEGRFRTWPEKSDRLVFFAIGDFGTGDSGQNRIAQAMTREFERRLKANDPVRFVITTGDIIYADANLLFAVSNSGDKDRDWEPKFFRPYERILASIPFLGSLGNHDGNSTEARADLHVYLDNFFFPDDKPSRWYKVSYGGLADVFALDTTDNSESGPPRPAYSEKGEQFEWMKNAFGDSKAPWKIPFFHHPPFNAGPRHLPYFEQLKHWLELFEKSGVRVAFAGHEHNLQFSEAGPLSRSIRFVITGAGGELRSGRVSGRQMQNSFIAGWAPQRHFCVVEIQGTEMKITPIGYEEIVVRDKNGGRMPMPLRVTLPVPTGTASPAAPR